MGLPSLAVIPHTQCTFSDGEETVADESAAEVGTTKTAGAETVGAEVTATELGVDDETVGAARGRAEVAVTEQPEVVDETVRVARLQAEGGGGAGRRGEATATVREDDTVDAGVVETAKPPERSKRVAIFSDHVAFRLKWRQRLRRWEDPAGAINAKVCRLHALQIALPRCSVLLASSSCLQTLDLQICTALKKIEAKDIHVIIGVIRMHRYFLIVFLYL